MSRVVQAQISGISFISINFSRIVWGALKTQLPGFGLPVSALALAMSSFWFGQIG